MTPEQRKNFNTVFGTLLLVTGLVAWGLTAYFAVTPKEAQPVAVSPAQAPVDLGSCRNALAELGYSASVQQGKIQASTPLTDNPRDQLEKASTAVLLCKLALETFCIGEGCEIPGVSFTLKQIGGQ